MRVVLTWNEVAVAAIVGMRRHIEALRAGRGDAFGRSDGDGWSAHIEGACGELAVAKSAGVYWAPSVNTFRAGGDVGRWQVRTRTRDDYELLIRDNDRDDAEFVLVRGRAPTFDVIGWIFGRDAKRDAWSKTHGGRPAAFFVPDCELLPMALAQPPYQTSDESARHAG
jgi:hypothetical protein